MKKFIILDENTINEIKCRLNELCGCADNVSYACGDDETAETIDRIETSISNYFEDSKIFEMDDTMEIWLKSLCAKQIRTINEMIRQENLWAMGSQTVEQSQIHVENMMRLEKYKQLFNNLIK